MPIPIDWEEYGLGCKRDVVGVGVGYESISVHWL